MTDTSVEDSAGPVAHRSDVVTGLRDGTPIAVGAAPYGLVMGIAAASAGFTLSQAAGLSAIVFAGLSQLAMADLLGDGAPVALVVATALVINVRFLMYSASIAPHFEELRTVWRWASPFFLVGTVYAVALSAFERDGPDHNGWYFIGVALPSWVTWIVGTLVGMTAGTRIPGEWQVGFAVPLIFIAILVEFTEDGPTVAAALAGGVVATLAAGLPLNTGLLVGGTVGIAAGLLADVIHR